ncbi:MAG TPA: hypothetical protein VHV82_09245 [Sporichthyaceae bacterium]|jgi:hypothetical protein|nr:hypothetical protein [Sporichthyaceae bacterium]
MGPESVCTRWAEAAVIRGLSGESAHRATDATSRAGRRRSPWNLRFVAHPARTTAPGDTPKEST